jgi:hypothetical protein
MAIISCPECKNSVSDTALKCPSCGTQLRKPKRGFFGKVFKFSFIAFNFLMAIWAVAGFNSATKDFNSLSGAEQAGAAVGTGIGMAMVLILWVLGAIILGMFVLFTRPKAA